MTTLSRFEIHQPATVREASQMLAHYGEEAGFYAGGTELLLAMRHKALNYRHLIDLKVIPGLDAIDLSGESHRDRRGRARTEASSARRWFAKNCRCWRNWNRTWRMCACALRARLAEICVLPSRTPILRRCCWRSKRKCTSKAQRAAGNWRWKNSLAAPTATTCSRAKF